MALLNTNPLKTAGIEEYRYYQEFLTNSTSAPTAQDGHGDTAEVTLARTGVGDFTLTFPESKRPQKMRGWECGIEGDEVNLTAKVTSYTASTGVLAITVYQNTAGTIAQADTTTKKVVVTAWFTRATSG